MALTPGTRLGLYEVAAQIGAGGMGEVYRARDTKLDRDVALKILPDAFVNDPERLARFQREAKVLASLNHPNIVTIHSVEEVDWSHFLTMELVEGRSLDRLISDGLSLEHFLAIATPLVFGLAAAHAKGLTHRDLNPANVMVGDDGRVKVLDFGLAKLAAAGLETDLETKLSTVPRTKVGVVMGTAPYMSPEQVQGRTRRTSVAGGPGCCSTEMRRATVIRPNSCSDRLEASSRRSGCRCT